MAKYPLPPSAPAGAIRIFQSSRRRFTNQCCFEDTVDFAILCLIHRGGQFLEQWRFMNFEKIPFRLDLPWRPLVSMNSIGNLGWENLSVSVLGHPWIEYVLTSRRNQRLLGVKVNSYPAAPACNEADCQDPVLASCPAHRSESEQKKGQRPCMACATVTRRHKAPTASQRA